MAALNVPVKAYKATDDHDIHFNQVVQDGSILARVRLKKVSEASGREVTSDEIMKGFEVTAGQYVTVTKAELESIKIKTAQAIVIEMFVPTSAIDPALIQGSYYLAPEKKKPDTQFQLLNTVMQRSNVVAVGKMVMREREHFVAVAPYGRGFLLELLAFPDEQRSIYGIDSLREMKPATFSEKDISLASQLVKAMTETQPDLSKAEFSTDRYTEQVTKMIEAKTRNEVYSPTTEYLPEVAQDLTAMLEKSIKAVQTAA